MSTRFLNAAGSSFVDMRSASAASVYSMNSCGTRVKFLFVICRLKSFDTCTSSLSAVFTSSGDFNCCCAEAGAASVRTDATAATVYAMRFISRVLSNHQSPITDHTSRHVQNAVHAFPVSGSRAEEWVVTGRRRRELQHHRGAFVGHRRRRDHAFVVRGNDAFVVFDVLVHGIHLSWMDEHPVVA